MEKMNYEKAVIRLEEIVEKLEKGDLSLEEMIKLYDVPTGASLPGPLCDKELSI